MLVLYSTSCAVTRLSSLSSFVSIQSRFTPGMIWVNTLTTARSVVLRDCSERFKSKFPSIMQAIAWSHEISFLGSRFQSGIAAIRFINSPAFLSICLSTEQEVQTAAQMQEHNAAFNQAAPNDLLKRLKTGEKKSMRVFVS